MFKSDELNKRTNSYEIALNSVYKKDNGIFNTEFSLAKKIIEFLDIPKEAIVLDPCCGVSNFLLSAKQCGIKNIFGADIDKKAVELSQELLGADCIKKIDTIANNGAITLKKLGIEKVPYIVGNPPYVPLSRSINIETKDYLFLRNVKDAGSNLFIGALFRALEMVQDGGIISYIVPKNFLHVAGYSLLRRKLLKEKQILSVVDLGKCFKDVRGEQILLTIKNGFANDNAIDFFSLANGGFVKTISIAQSFFNDEIIIFENQSDFEIYKKLNDTYQKFSNVKTGYIGRGRSKSANAISGKDIRKFGFKTVAVPQKGNQVFIQNIYSAEAGIIACFGGDLEATETVTVFTDGDPKMCHYITGVLHSNLCNFFLVKYCYNNSTLTMHTDPNYLLRIPLERKPETFDQIVNVVKTLEKVDYMSNEWFLFVAELNRLVYQTYGLGKEQIDFIETTIKAIQSSRWHNDERKAM
ncbi:MAG: N-6 DNA methylase [Chitinivibrionia bacterium]|nr:N-6 DNA methylase [Chitinivibrionia bacterium]